MNRHWRLPSRGRASTTCAWGLLTDDGDPRLAAAVELISPRNKDRAKSREAFATKCAEHLRRGGRGCRRDSTCGHARRVARNA